MFTDFAPILKAATIKASAQKTTVTHLTATGKPRSVTCKCCGSMAGEGGRIFHNPRCLFKSL